MRHVASTGRQLLGRSDCLKTSRRYVECVNARDIGGLEELLAEGCRLIDSSGGWIEGRETCLGAFERFFEIEPHYRLEIHTMSRSGDNILISGRSTASDARFAMSRLFRARADEHHLHEWQSYSAARGAAVCRFLVGDKAQMGPFLESPY